MFDFEQLRVYQKSLTLNKKVFEFLKTNKQIDYFLQDQLKRASVSISLNIAEGVGRQTMLDRKRFYVISRGSAFEVTAILQIINNQYSISQDDYYLLIQLTKEIINMLFGLIKNSQLKKIRET